MGEGWCLLHTERDSEWGFVQSVSLRKDYCVGISLLTLPAGSSPTLPYLDLFDQYTCIYSVTLPISNLNIEAASYLRKVNDFTHFHTKYEFLEQVHYRMNNLENLKSIITYCS